jgi:serpin B
LRIILAAIAVATATIMAVTAPAQVPPKPVPPIIRAENAFAFDVFARLHQQPGNVFLSPYSLYSAIGMAYLGARGTTAPQIAHVLHLDPTLEGNGRNASSEFAHDLTQSAMFGGQRPMDFHFHTENAVWMSPRFQIRPRYAKAIKQNFAGMIATVDFAHPSVAAARINQWVATATAGRINSLISPADLSARTRMILTNAVYFRARWSITEIFAKSLTKSGSFHPSAGLTVTVPMMHQTGMLPIAQADGVKVLRLDYDGPAAMFIILPDRASDLKRIEGGLSAAELDRWVAIQNKPSNNPPYVIVTLPRFAANNNFMLTNTLKSLGMPAAFSPRSDFNGIAASADGRLTLSGVIQQSAITVDETGTEAMAATGLEAVSASAAMPNPPPPILFNANHPFLYVIRADGTGAILFIGREDNPATG